MEPTLQKALGLVALVVLLSGCSTTPMCSCPAIAVSQAYYVGSFVSGEQSPPIQFTAIGETATITFQTFNNNQRAPLAPVSGTKNGPCSAATLESLATPGEIEVKSVAKGTCTFLISSSGVSQIVSVTVR